MAHKNSYLFIMLGDFDTKSKTWFSNDVTKGDTIGNTSSNFGLHQSMSQLMF